MSHNMPANYRVLSSISRIDLLNTLLQRGTMSVDDLAAATGLHANTAREHLHRLIDAGFVRSEALHRDHRGRPRLLYTAQSDPADPRRAEKVRRAFERADQVRRLIDPASAASPVSNADRQLDVLEDHMDECGFDASVDIASDDNASGDNASGDGMRLTVHSCPFDRLAEEHPQVCRVHYALLSASLDEVDGPLEADELHARVPGEGCWVTLKLRESDAQAQRDPVLA